jgi:hypothetical protein
MGANSSKRENGAVTFTPGSNFNDKKDKEAGSNTEKDLIESGKVLKNKYAVKTDKRIGEDGDNHLESEEVIHYDS